MLKGWGEQASDREAGRDGGQNRENASGLRSKVTPLTAATLRHVTEFDTSIPQPNLSSGVC